MKLYKLFEEIILEASEKKLLTENVSDDEVIDAINQKYNVNITYDDYPDSETPVPPSKRYIQVYNFAETKAGNKAIRAFQIFGGSKTTPKKGAWKIFRLDRIRSWQPTKVKWQEPVSNKDTSIPTYNKVGDRTMNKVFNKVQFGQQQNVNSVQPKSTSKPTTKNIAKPIAKTQQSSYISQENPSLTDTSTTTGIKNNKKLKK